MALEGEGFGTSLGHKGRAFIRRDRTEFAFFLLFPPREDKETTVYKLERGTSPEPFNAGTLILDFQSLGLWEINVCC